MIVNIIGARDEQNQKEVWASFIDVMSKSQNSNIDIKQVKEWFGIDIGAFTIFLFWIDSKNFLPLDKNTIAFLLKYKKINDIPNSWSKYKTLLMKQNTNLYQNIALIAYDELKYELLDENSKQELWDYLGVSIILHDDIYSGEIEKDFYEGNSKKVYVNQYERDPKARQACLEKKGYICEICEFDFEKKYGEIGKNAIHVHHIVPLHQTTGKYKVDPIKDLMPVCPNCHLILHRKGAPTVEELKKIVNLAISE